MNPITRTLQFAGLGALLALGCASTSTAPAPTAAKEQPATTQATPGEVTSQRATSSFLEPVYFNTDLALIRPDTRAALKTRAKAILAHPEWGMVRIEGHCDERGSEEYNLALGGARANAVERYLVDLGVPASRLTTATYGEARPAVPGHDESAWRYNRRSELLSEAFRSTKR